MRDMKELNLTGLEEQVLTHLINGLYAEAGYSDVDATDITEWSGIPIKSVRGVLSSLVKKGIIHIEGNDSGYQLIYLLEEHWGLHPEWKSEI
jgi:sugar-specific transcriptional regulator TrmB